MQRAQAQDLGLAGAVWGAGVVEIHAFEALEEPAHGRPGGGLAHLVGHGLGGRGQALAHPHLGQLIDQQTEHHDEGDRHDALGLLHEHRGGQKEGVFEKGKPALGRRLGAVAGDDGVIGPGLDVEEVGPDDKGGAALRARGPRPLG
jgi:hypothetical protein